MKSSTKSKANSLKPVETTAAVASRWQPAWWHWVLGGLLTLFIAFEVYGPALNGEFLFDDSYLPFMSSRIADGELKDWLGVRPALMISYWLNYQSSGLDPYPYHVVGVLLHVLNAFLAGFIVWRLLGWVGEQGWMREALSIFAGAIFLLHPVQTESVAYVTSRSETMSVFFFLAAYAVFVYRRTESISVMRAIIVILLFGVACTVKEHTTVLPALLLLTDYYFITPFRFTGIRRNLKLYAPIAVGAVFGLIAVFSVLQRADSAGFRIKDFTWYEYLFTQFRVIWLYLRLYVAPFGQNGDYGWAPSRSILDGGALFGLLGLLALAVLAWRYRREYPLASFGYFGFLILLAPTSSIVPIRDVAVERRMYLPFICLLFITVDLLRRWKTSRTVMIGAMTAVSLVAGVASYQRNHVWSSALAFWEDTTAKSPQNARARFQLAYAQWQGGKCQEAVANYERVARMEKPDDRLLLDWALALECAEKPDEAVGKIREALQQQPSAHGYSMIGMIYGKRGRVDEALAALSVAEKTDPNFEMTYVYRGNIFASRGQTPLAIGEYKRALAINPNNTYAQQGLAAAQSPR
jgi:tetratricopeptide (TPR) repeat protein